MQKPPLPNGTRPFRRIARWLPLLLGLGAPLSAQVNYATPYTFQVLAGLAGNAGSTDGTGSAARFNHPYGLAVDSSGNVYVADRANAVIRKITPAGVVTTIAGRAGVPGSVDGNGTAALFNNPSGVAVDGTGNLYVADTGNDTIRKITPGGTSSIFAGSAGGVGSADGTGATVQFNSPNGIAIDGSGNLYVADSGNNTIRKITSGGVSSTLAGSPGAPGFTDGHGIF